MILKIIKKIHLHEVVRCLRRSYYDRTDRIDPQWTSFNNLLTGLLQKMEYGGKEGEYPIEDITLKGKSDIIVDDAIIIFRSTLEIPDNPFSSDLLYLKCLYVDIQKNRRSSCLHDFKRKRSVIFLK